MDEKIEERLKRLDEEKKEAERLERTVSKEERELKREEVLEEELARENGSIGRLEERRRRLIGLLSERLNIAFMAVIFAIILITIYFRVSLLQYYGFFEPDGFYHFSVIRAAVNNGFVVPHVLGISGWPEHAPVTEPQGLYWVTLFPYFFLRFLGVSYYTVMRLVPIFFGILDVLGTYLIAKRISKDRFFLILAMLFVALSLGDAARTSGIVYRGDGFVTIFLILALYFTMRVFEKESSRGKLYSAILAGISIAIGSFVWNGASFAIAVYIIGFAFVLAYAFAAEKKEVLENTKYMLAALLLWYILANLMKFTEVTTAQTFTGRYFLVLYAFMLIGFFLAKYLYGKKYAFTRTWRARVATIAAFILIAVIVIYVFAPVLVYQVFVANGFEVTNNFAATIEELQPPTPSFLFASFGPELFVSPTSLVIFAASHYTSMHALFFFLFLIFSLAYLFMRVESNGGFFDGKASVGFEATAAMLLLIAYYAATAYLQMHAIRFNSLVSVPLAIFSAYTIYWLATYFRKYNYIAFGIIFTFVVYLFATDMVYSTGLTQADSINPSFISALAWMKNNTPANAVVLTLWPDGSVVEGVANKTSVMDSVGSQNASKADPFAAWLFNSSDDPSILTSNLFGKPDYLLVRFPWLSEIGGIYTESGISESSNDFAYSTFASVSEHVNSTEQLFQFSSPGSSVSARLVFENANGTKVMEGFAILPSGASPFSYVALYNEYNNSFSIINQTRLNFTNGNMLLVEYSPIPNPREYVNVTGAFIFANGIARSNMMKFLYFCNNNSCLWNNNMASLRLVYANSDTKIFRIVYNTSS